MLKQSSVNFSSYIRRLTTLLLVSIWVLFLGACDSTSPSLPGPVPQPPSESPKGNESVIGRGDGRYALLVAVRHYEKSDLWPSLERDLEPLAEVLRGFDFEVEVLYDPDGYTLIDRFDSLVRNHGDREGNHLLFFFAGRAYTEGNQAYLLPADSLRPEEENFYRRTLSLGHLEEEALALEARRALFLFDSSFSDLVFSDQQPANPGSGKDRELLKARQLIAAGQEDQPVPRQSTFMPLLIQALDGEADLDKDELITGTELHSWLLREMSKAGSGQKPQYAELGDPDNRDDFVFDLMLSPEQVLAAMQLDFALIRNDDDLSAEDKVEAWTRFLETYPPGHASLAEEEKLRQRAKVRLEFWEWESSPAPEISGVGESEGEREETRTDRLEVDRQEQQLEQEELEQEELEQEELKRERREQEQREQDRQEQEDTEAQTSGAPLAEPPSSAEESSQPEQLDGEEQRQEEARQEEARQEEARQEEAKQEEAKKQLKRLEPEKRKQVPGRQRPKAGEERELLKVPGSALLLKVVGLSDNISIFDALDNDPKQITTMKPLKPYFVLEDTGDHYRISSQQEEGGIEGYVAKTEVTPWNTREGLHFIPDTLAQQRRDVVEAWSKEEEIRAFAKSLDLKSHGPDLGEELQTRVGKQGAIPYPLLQSKEIDVGGRKRTIHQVLIPTTVSLNIVETELLPEQVREVVGAVTVCVVFDASRSMRAYARTFADTLTDMLDDFSSETRISVGFILFREPGRNLTDRFETFQPNNVGEAIEWLQDRVRDTFGGTDSREPEPVLDAMMLAQNSFLWNNWPAIRGASRIVILVANEHAALTTQGAARTVQPGKPLEEVALSLLRNRIRVFSLQAGNVDRGNLVEVLRTLASETGGEFYRSAVRRGDIREKFTGEIRNVLNRSISEGRDAASRLELTEREGGGTVIAVDALTEDLRQRLEKDAREFHVPDGGLLIKKAWLFEQPGLYREEILVDKDLLKDLISFFTHISQSSFTTRDFEKSTAALLEALIGEELVGEQLEAGVDIQELLEKAVGANFETNLMSFPLEYLSRLSPEEQRRLQENIQSATAGLADFYEINLRRFEEKGSIWMPVDYLP